MLPLILASVAVVLATWWAATARVNAQYARRASIPPRPEVTASGRALTVPIVNFSDRDPERDARAPDIAAVVREGLLELRNAELRLILDTVDQGFVTVQPDGQLLPERSAILERWTGELPVRASIWDVVERLDPAARAWMKNAWEQIREDYMPLPVALAQLPRRLIRDDHCWDIAYYPVAKGQTLQRVVVVLTDVSAELERQRALAEQQDFAALVERLVTFRRGYFEFWNEATTLVDTISSADASGPELRRELHTLKGSSRFVGLLGLASVCHELEQAVNEREACRLRDDERARIRAAWDNLRRRMEPLLQGAQGVVEFAEEDFARLASGVRARAPHEKLYELLQNLRIPSTATRLAAAKKHLVDVCKRLHKSPPEITLVDDDLRLSPARFAHFWSVFVHVLNNTADHGVESDEQRLALGKSLPAKLALSTRRSGGCLVVEVTDDGPGIDWKRVAARAKERNLPHQTHDHLVAALFGDAFSLRDCVSEFSGRGVGLAAVKNAVQALDGSIEVESALISGTSIRFRLPLEGALRDAAATGRVAQVAGA